MNSQENIYLIGFMGSGKTTLTSKLKEVLNYNEMDLDEEVVALTNQSIPSLFEKQGEAYFRKLESEILNKTADQMRTVIATGGGIVTKPENRAFLKGKQSIYLKWSFETLYDRVKGDKNRPLAKSYESLRELYNKRQALYEEAAKYIIEGNNQSEEQIVEQILSQLGVKK